MAEISPAHKKEEKTNKDNYRPVSIFPSVSTSFERIVYDEIEKYMSKRFSAHLCGFRKGTVRSTVLSF